MRILKDEEARPAAGPSRLLSRRILISPVRGYTFSRQNYRWIYWQECSEWASRSTEDLFRCSGVPIDPCGCLRQDLGEGEAGRAVVDRVEGTPVVQAELRVRGLGSFFRSRRSIVRGPGSFESLKLCVFDDLDAVLGSSSFLVNFRMF